VLRFCYPFEDLKITVPSGVLDVIDAMRKYELVQLERAVDFYFHEEALASRPFEYYAIACRLQLQEQAQKAAFYILPQGTDLPAAGPSSSLR
jgi:hypothetical protein